MRQVRIKKIFDAHVHFRSLIPMMLLVVEISARVCSDVLAMPNLKKLDHFPGPILNAQEANAYKRRIETVAEGKTHGTFRPHVTIQIRGDTTPSMIEEAADVVLAGKLYPDGVTTNSAGGVTDFEALWPVFDAMQRFGMVLCIHGELPDAEVLERESAFLPVLTKIAEAFPNLKIVLEHVSTAEGLEAVHALGDNVVCTVTAHHLTYFLDDLLGGELKPHRFCKPVVKPRRHLEALRNTLTSKKVMFGSDSAPHEVSSKHAPSCCAGCFTAIEMVSMVVQVFMDLGYDIFDDAQALQLFEDFMGNRGREFYGLDTPQDEIQIIEQDWVVPTSVTGGGVSVIPLMADQTLKYKVLYS